MTASLFSYNVKEIVFYQISIKMKLESNLENKISNLNELRSDLLNLAHKNLTLDNKNFYTIDWLFFAAINRSISNIAGFIEMINHDNFLLMNSIVRLQLDTVIRFYAIHLVNDPNDLINRILGGEEIKKIKDKNGNKMTDRYLCEQLSQKDNGFHWVNVYDHGCGFIHLCRTHIPSFLDEQTKSPDGTYQVTFGQHGGNAVSQDTKIESIDCMYHLSTLLYKLLHEWVIEKKLLLSKKS